jgi:hypothetical protein
MVPAEAGKADGETRIGIVVCGIRLLVIRAIDRIIGPVAIVHAMIPISDRPIPGRDVPSGVMAIADMPTAARVSW